MISEQRKELRYQRRKAKREIKERERNKRIGTLEEVFSFDNMFQYGLQCCKNVGWKQSTQNFQSHLLSNTAKQRKKILDGKYKPKHCTEFILHERGKIRDIEAPHITDRQVQKVLTHEILFPLYGPSIVKENGASQLGKGLHYQFNILKQHLRWHFRRYGHNGGILLLDFKKFFPSISHEIVYEKHKNMIDDERIRQIADCVIPQNRDCGMPLGVESIQVEMISFPSPLDNYIKCQLGIKCFGHYMDDYYIIYNDIEELKEIKKKLMCKINELELVLNEDKTKIVPLTKAFKFCKATFKITDTGKIIVRGNRDSMKRARHKLKAMKIFYEEGKVHFFDIQQLFACNIGYFKNYNDHNRILRLNRLFYNLFIKGANTMEYVAMKNCSFQGIKGKVKANKGDIFEENFDMISKNGVPICTTYSQNGRDYFCKHDVSSMYQYDLAEELINYLEKDNDSESDAWQAYNECEDSLMKTSSQLFPFWKNHIREQPIGVLQEMIERVIKNNV